MQVVGSVRPEKNNSQQHADDEGGERDAERLYDVVLGLPRLLLENAREPTTTAQNEHDAGPPCEDRKDDAHDAAH